MYMSVSGKLRSRDTTPSGRSFKLYALLQVLLSNVAAIEQNTRYVEEDLNRQGSICVCLPN